MYFAYNNSSVNCLSSIVLRPDHHHYIFNKYSKGRIIGNPGRGGGTKSFGHEFFSDYLSLQGFFKRSISARIFFKTAFALPINEVACFPHDEE